MPDTVFNKNHRDRTSVCAMPFILPCIGICNPLMEYLVMKTNVAEVDDTIGNAETCKKYCGACPTFRNNQLKDSPPHELFCARGKSSIAEKTKTGGCYCPACEVFTKYKLVIGYFCAK